MSNDTPTESRPAAAARGLRGALLAGALALPLAAGAVGSTLAQTAEIVPTTVAPVSVSALAPSGAIAAKGQVAEIYGNKFILVDPTGRALVEMGREGAGLVKAGETLTVQGRFEDGFLHARLVTREDGSSVRLGPGAGPKAGSMAWAKDKMGLGPSLDPSALTAVVARAGYTDVRVIGRGPKHLEVAAKAPDGRERILHVHEDGRVREHWVR